MENREKKEMYVEPKIIATYTKEELEETIKPHGSTGSINGYINNSLPQPSV